MNTDEGLARVSNRGGHHDLSLGDAILIKQVAADNGRCPENVDHKHALFELAQVVAASHHLLSGVAALGKAHAANKLEVEHLRHKGVEAGKPDPGQTRLDFSSHPLGLGGDGGIRCNLSLFWHLSDQPRPGVPAGSSRGKTEQECLGGRAGHVATRGHVRPPETPNTQIGKGDGDLGSQHKKPQAFCGLIGQFRGDDGQVTVGCWGPEPKDGKQASFGRAVALQLMLTRIGQLVGELAQQKSCRVWSGDLQHGKGQTGGEAVLAHGPLI